MAPQAGPPASTRVLLVDDDATLRRLVAMMLEELPITLLCCEGVAQALAELRRAPVQLLITDWMMPRASGLDLLQALQQEPALRGDARVVVFSAGLDGLAAERMQSLGVWRTLAKPVSLHAMESCVREGLGWRADGTSAPGSAPEPAAAETEAEAEAEAEALAIQQHFAGQAALYRAFRTDCLQQFKDDVQTGDAAMSSADWPALRRLAHTLKSVLRMLGHEAAAQLALELEEASAAGDAAAAAVRWPELRRLCLALGG